MNDKFKDPRDLASQLAHKAHRRRLRDRIRMDDISVLVVDVFPQFKKIVRGRKGGCTNAMKIVRHDTRNFDGGYMGQMTDSKVGGCLPSWSEEFEGCILS